MTMQHLGMGFPNGAVDLQKIIDLPSPYLLLLSSEHWHYDSLVSQGKQVIFRAMAREGYRPAERGYLVDQYVMEILRDVGKLKITDFVSWNELDLNYERGDNRDDSQGLERRYEVLGGFTREVIIRLRMALPGVKLHFGAWTPNKDHQAIDHVEWWRWAAESCDVIDFHAYDTLENIEHEYDLYRAAFPGKPLALTEWHGKGDLEEERRILARLQTLMLEDPLFDAAYFFIYRWDNPSEWWSEAYDVEHNPERLALFTTIEAPAMPDYHAMAIDAAVAAGIDTDLFVRQIDQESGFNPNAYNAGSNASGIAQIIPRWHPLVDVWNPQASLTYAAQLMASHLKATHGDYALALSYYNAGPGNTANGLAGQLTGWPYPETVTYVSNILQISAAEAKRRLTGSAAPSDQARLYGLDVPDSVIRQQNDWTCSVRSLYGALWALHAQDEGPEVTYGDGGPNDVYNWMVPTFANSAVGLLNADGSGLVALLWSKGLTPSKKINPSLADVQLVAGVKPVLLGSGNWPPGIGHWVYVRGVEADGTLILENPAGTVMGISDQLKDSFDKIGGWTMVTIDPIPRVQEPPVPEPTDALAAMTAERDLAISQRNGLIESVAYIGDDLGDALERASAEILRIRDELRSQRLNKVGPRP